MSFPQLPKVPKGYQQFIYAAGAVTFLVNALLYRSSGHYADAFPFLIVAMLFAILWYVISKSPDDNDPKPPKTRGTGGRGLCAA